MGRSSEGAGELDGPSASGHQVLADRGIVAKTFRRRERRRLVGEVDDADAQLHAAQQQRGACAEGVAAGEIVAPIGINHAPEEPSRVSFSGRLTTEGSAVSSSAGMIALRASIAAWSITVTGAIFSKSSRLMFEPVTTKRWSFMVASATPLSGRVCADKVAESRMSRPARRTRAGRREVAGAREVCMVFRSVKFVMGPPGARSSRFISRSQILTRATPPRHKISGGTPSDLGLARADISDAPGRA